MAENIIEGVKPTRMELLAIRKKKKLAEKGHKLLGEKRDALVMQFFEVIKTRDTLRNDVNNKLAEAYSLTGPSVIFSKEAQLYPGLMAEINDTGLRIAEDGVVVLTE